MKSLKNQLIYLYCPGLLLKYVLYFLSFATGQLFIIKGD